MGSQTLAPKAQTFLQKAPNSRRSFKVGFRDLGVEGCMTLGLEVLGVSGFSRLGLRMLLHGAVGFPTTPLHQTLNPKP